MSVPSERNDVVRGGTGKDAVGHGAGDRAPAVTAVVVTYNSSRTLGPALDALRRCHEARVARTIVVDNASADATWDIIRANSGWLTGVSNRRNIGFGRGCNVGLAQVETPLVVFVNPDAQLEPAVCAAMSNLLASNERAGIVAPALLEADGGLQHFGGLATPASILWKAAGRGATKSEASSVGPAPFRTDWVCGALFMSRAALLRTLGGFDERFFLYYEETDLCRRVADAGWEIWAMPSQLANHIGGASSSQSGVLRVHGCIAEHLYRSRFYYLRKHFGLAPAVATECAELALIGARSLLRAVRGRPMTELAARLRSPFCREPEQEVENA